MLQPTDRPPGFFVVYVQSLLHDPNVNSPANNEAARLYREHRREYDKKVAAVVQESWLEDEEDEADGNVKDEERVSGRRDVDSVLAGSDSWGCAVVYDCFDVELWFVLWMRRSTYLLSLWVFARHIPRDTLCPADVRCAISAALLHVRCRLLQSSDFIYICKRMLCILWLSMYDLRCAASNVAFFLKVPTLIIQK